MIPLFAKMDKLPTIAEAIDMTDKQLIDTRNRFFGHVPLDQEFIAEESWRRFQSCVEVRVIRDTRTIRNLTISITVLTVAATLATFVNLALLVAPLIKK